MSDVERALEDLIEREEAKAAETDQNAKGNQDRENAEDIRKKAMEILGQMKKRKTDEREGEERKRKKRSNGSETLNFLREKNERVREMQKEELELKRKQLELETKKQDNFMQVMLSQCNNSRNIYTPRTFRL